MSSKARRVRVAEVHRFPWRHRSTSAATAAATATALAAILPDEPVVPVATIAIADATERMAAVERDAFARGYEQGGRAVADATAAQTDAMLTRMGETVEELITLRRRLAPRMEREVVELALAIAARVVRRAITMDRELVVAIARVALERIGDRQPVTVRLNPEDHAYTLTRSSEPWAGDGVTVVADPDVPRGGCRIESPFGSIDTGIDAQLGEIARGLLPDVDDSGLSRE